MKGVSTMLLILGLTQITLSNGNLPRTLPLFPGATVENQDQINDIREYEGEQTSAHYFPSPALMTQPQKEKVLADLIAERQRVLDHAASDKQYQSSITSYEAEAVEKQFPGISFMNKQCAQQWTKALKHYVRSEQALAKAQADVLKAQADVLRVRADAVRAQVIAVRSPTIIFRTQVENEEEKADGSHFPSPAQMNPQEKQTILADLFLKRKLIQQTLAANNGQYQKYKTLSKEAVEKHFPGISVMDPENARYWRRLLDDYVRSGKAVARTQGDNEEEKNRVNYFPSPKKMTTRVRQTILAALYQRIQQESGASSSQNQRSMDSCIREAIDRLFPGIGEINQECAIEWVESLNLYISSGKAAARAQEDVLKGQSNALREKAIVASSQIGVTEEQMEENEFPYPAQISKRVMNNVLANLFERIEKELAASAGQFQKSILLYEIEAVERHFPGISYNKPQCAQQWVDLLDHYISSGQAVTRLAADLKRKKRKTAEEKTSNLINQ